VIAASAPLVAVGMIAACIWVGSLVCLALVANAARHVLDGRAQVAFFSAVGRPYGIVGSTSLLVAIGVGVALAWPPSSWSGTIAAAAALAGVLVILTAAGMVQARSMSRLRRRALSVPADGVDGRAVRRGRKLAGGLRAAMAAVTLTIVVLAAQAISQ
jgi:hypothetical protein